MADHERRKYPRLNLPVFVRKPTFRERWLQVSDVSLGGCRFFSRVEMKVGQVILLEVRLPTGQTLKTKARVVWTANLPQGGVAPFDVGLEFQNMEAGDYARLRSYLDDPRKQATEFDI